MQQKLADTIRELQKQRPFEPLRLTTTNGEKVVILDPSKMIVAQMRLICIDSASDRTTMLDFSKLRGIEVFRPLAAE